MKINKSVILSFLLIISLVFNYFLYKENSNFKLGRGAEYQLAVRLAIHNDLDEDVFSYIVEELTNGNLSPFEAWERDIASLNSSLQKTGNIHYKVLGDLLNHIPKQVEELTVRSSKPGNEIDTIKSQMLYFNEMLSKVEAELDEELMKWYREISNDKSKTSKYVEKQLKAVIKY